MRIGILALHGAFREHQRILAKCEVESILICKPEEMDDIDGLIISGDEGNAILKLMREYNLHEKILKKKQSKACRYLVFVPA